MGNIEGRGTYVVASENSQVEGQELQWDDTQDSLQAVHTVGHIDGVAGVLDGLVIVFVADHDGPTLQSPFSVINDIEFLQFLLPITTSHVVRLS